MLYQIEYIDGRGNLGSQILIAQNSHQAQAYFRGSIKKLARIISVKAIGFEGNVNR